MPDEPEEVMPTLSMENYEPPGFAEFQDAQVKLYNSDSSTVRQLDQKDTTSDNPYQTSEVSQHSQYGEESNQ